ncbi:family 20 glycosylhydrolase, partial [Evtepia sp.]|uniref:family 20 glycosylhydrolase n=1 Tax=Evtepia sp. TaxID=2773933 RepID=UPI002A83A868
MSRLKKGLALVLTLCMMLSLVPVITPSAKATDEGDFTRIFHLDAGRKYFSVDQIKALIDTLKANNYTHMELAVGNDGLRFLLDNMSVTANDTTYASDAVKAGIQAGNKTYYDAGTYNELTQTEMDTIISYANEKGIGIIPLINTPGHMDAILDCMEGLDISSPAYNNSTRTVDVTNTAAVNFTLALVNKYIQYFAGKGCEFFNMGCDEYANDVSNSGFAGLISSGKYGNFITYVNNMAAQVEAAGMTPMAFNDGIYYNSNISSGTFDTKIAIAYWTSGWGGYS